MKKTEKNNLKVIYVSRTCSREKFSEINNKVNTCAAQKYNLLLAEGLARNGAKIKLLSNPPIQNKIWNSRKQETKNGIQFVYYSFLNLPIFRKIFSFFSVFFNVLFCSKKKTVIIADTLVFSATFGALIASKIRRKPLIGIVTDVPGCGVENSKLNFSEKLYRLVTKHCSAYLFLTEQMSDIINKKHKPFIVLEGHVDFTMSQADNLLTNKDSKKICLFAGNLAKVNGLNYLIDGFLDANIPNVFLDIYGAGELAQDIENISKKHANIRFMGNRPNSEIVQAEQKATLLINPRPSDQIFTKYSFPSKNMEYMASGTPLLTTHLPCIPSEYDPYLYYIEEESAEGISKKLKFLLNKEPKELHQFGAQAKAFVVSEKSNVVQAEKLLNFIQDNF